MQRNLDTPLPLTADRWGDVEGTIVRREFKITNGEIKPGGIRAGIIRADYVLIYKNRKLAVNIRYTKEKGKKIFHPNLIS